MKASLDVSRLASPEEIAAGAGSSQVPLLHLPERVTVFAERAQRLRQLAAGHAMRDYLLFAADLVQAQHDRLQAHPAPTVPDPAALDAAAQDGRALLDAAATLPDTAWRDDLRAILAPLAARLPAGPARATVERVRDADAAWLDDQATRLVGGRSLGLDLAAAPLVGAALQVAFTDRVLATQAAHAPPTAAANAGAVHPVFGRPDDGTRCPCCASRPTASVVRLGAETSGYRYLHCSLCSTQWHMVRVKCTRCESTKGIAYQSLEALPGHAASPTAAAPGAVQAETCDECGHYLKIVHLAKDNHAEPVADDLASLTLDLLVGDAGLHRHGVNLLFAFGEPDDGAVPDTEPPDPGGP